MTGIWEHEEDGRKHELQASVYYMVLNALRENYLHEEGLERYLCTFIRDRQKLLRTTIRTNDILVLNGFVNTIDWDQNQSDLSDLTQSMRRVTGTPWIADFRSWTWPEVVIFSADQKDRGLWGRECCFSLL